MESAIHGQMSSQTKWRRNRRSNLSQRGLEHTSSCPSTSLTCTPIPSVAPTPQLLLLTHFKALSTGFRILLLQLQPLLPHTLLQAHPHLCNNSPWPLQPIAPQSHQSLFQRLQIPRRSERRLVLAQRTRFRRLHSKLSPVVLLWRSW